MNCALGGYGHADDADSDLGFARPGEAREARPNRVAQRPGRDLFRSPFGAGESNAETNGARGAFQELGSAIAREGSGLCRGDAKNEGEGEARGERGEIGEASGARVRFNPRSFPVFMQFFTRPGAEH
jgi:hypothetical protein